MANRIQLRRDHSTNWTRINPVLSDGEPGLEIDTNKVKYGDGITVWRELSYASGAGTTFTVTNISYFTNDAEYLTSSSAVISNLQNSISAVMWEIPTAVSSLTNDIGYLTSATVNQYVNSFSGTNQLVSGPYTVSLDGTGVLSLSSASTILGIGTDPNVYIETINSGTTSTWTFGTNGVLTLPAETPVIQGGGIDTNVTIIATTGTNTATWVFAADGTLTFPDNTVQTTASTGTRGGSLIKSYVSTGTETHFDFVVPSRFTDLELSFLGQLSANTAVGMYFNGDYTDSHYSGYTVNHYGNGRTTNLAELGNCSGVPGYSNSAFTKIPAYNSNQAKQGNGLYNWWSDNDLFNAYTSFVWTTGGTAPITSIRVYANSGATFNTGTVVSLFGIGGDISASVSGGRVLLLDTIVSSTASNINLTGMNNSAYISYEIELIDFQSDDKPCLQFSTDGGATYDTAGSYDWSYTVWGSNGYDATVQSANASHIQFSGGGATAPNASDLSIKICNPGSTTCNKQVTAIVSFSSGDGANYNSQAGGRYRNVAAINGVRLISATGNITGGRVRFYGTSI